MRHGVTVVVAIFVPHFAFMQIAAHVGCKLLSVTILVCVTKLAKHAKQHDCPCTGPRNVPCRVLGVPQHDCASAGYPCPPAAQL
jgi:hypothetical protein